MHSSAAARGPDEHSFCLLDVQRGCTEPLRRGRFRFEHPSKCTGDLCMPGEITPETEFEVPKGLGECVVEISPPVVSQAAGLTLRLVMHDTWGAAD
jgi:hypothetical protein